MTSGDAFQDRVLELVEKHEHIGVAHDIALAEQIPEAERCKRCDGSGNQLMFMYQRCEACGGDGRSRGNEHEFKD